MTKLDEFFNKPTLPLNPHVRNWATHLQQGYTATVEVYWPQLDFGMSQPEIDLQFIKNSQLLPLESMPWSKERNAGLIQLGIRSESPEFEAVRFALSIRDAMHEALCEFGDGYFNSVVVELLKDSDMASYAQIANILKDIYQNNSHRNGGKSDSCTICRDLIIEAISGRARELTDNLNYPQEAAKDILINAIAKYLDHRFSVTTRRRYGLLNGSTETQDNHAARS